MILRLVLLLLCVVWGRDARGEAAAAADGRQKIEAMTPAEKEDLLRRQDWFASLPVEEQQRIRKLHQQISGAADGGELRQVMRRYHRWLMEIPPYRRAELLDLPPAKRIEEIKKLCAEEAQRKTRSLDVEGLLRWMAQYAAKNRDQLLATVPKSRRESINKMSQANRDRLVGFWIAAQWQRLRAGERPGEGPRLTDDDLKGLRACLSEETRRQLESKPASEQWRQIDELAFHAMRSAWSPGRSKGSPPEEYEKELDAFFNQLSAEERERLLDLPGEELQRELRRTYMMGTRMPGPPGPPPFGMYPPPPGEGPGDNPPERDFPRRPRGEPRQQESGQPHSRPTDSPGGPPPDRRDRSR